MRTFTATQAKQNFGELLDTINSDDVSITRNGREVALVTRSKRNELTSGIPDIVEAKRKIIFSYFNGELPLYKAMRLGGYQWYGELLNDAKRFNISMPATTEEQNKIMMDSLLKKLNGENHD